MGRKWSEFTRDCEFVPIWLDSWSPRGLTMGTKSTTSCEFSPFQVT